MRNKGGIGVGSASIVLVFAVICLTVFSLITFIVATNDKALVDAEVRRVTGYYEADAQAEYILAELLAADTLPSSVRGIDINTQWNEELGTETIYFLYPVSDINALYVDLAIRGDSFDILSWRMRDTDDWEFDDSINVWSGEID